MFLCQRPSEHGMRGQNLMKSSFLDYFRSHHAVEALHASEQLSMDAGFFRWGEDTVCYGRSAAGFRSDRVDSSLYNVLDDTQLHSANAILPFDDEEVIENLLYERYTAHFRKSDSSSNEIIRSLYYLLRPYLTVSTRKYLQRLYLRNWRNIKFPEWPVDCTVDRIQRRLLSLAMRARSVDTLPFIWFWPDRYTSCAIITHDVEGPRGRDFCGRVMDLDESFGFRSSFQIVPEDRYVVPKDYLELIAKRGYEVNVHDLKHDGLLYAKRDEFLRRAFQINKYAREFGAFGFRSGILYRNADWYDAYDFLYDMSIPNVGHLDPQRGGCCTVMPYFIGKMVELPVTCTQDYTLFHVLNDYTTTLWRRQIEIIRDNYGLVSLLVHPDYIAEPRAQETYKEILAHLSLLRETDGTWAPLPREVAEWWHQRREMRLVCVRGEWRVEGMGAERACVAYAHVSGDTVTYSLNKVKHATVIY